MGSNGSAQPLLDTSFLSVTVQRPICIHFVVSGLWPHPSQRSQFHFTLGRTANQGRWTIFMTNPDLGYPSQSKNSNLHLMLWASSISLGFAGWSVTYLPGLPLVEGLSCWYLIIWTHGGASSLAIPLVYAMYPQGCENQMERKVACTCLECHRCQCQRAWGS